MALPKKRMWMSSSIIGGVNRKITAMSMTVVTPRVNVRSPERHPRRADRARRRRPVDCVRDQNRALGDPSPPRRRAARTSVATSPTDTLDERVGRDADGHDQAGDTSWDKRYPIHHDSSVITSGR